MLNFVHKIYYIIRQLYYLLRYKILTFYIINNSIKIFQHKFLSKNKEVIKLKEYLYNPKDKEFFYMFMI